MIYFYIKKKKRFTCSLQEAVIPEDPSTENPKIIPTFNGLTYIYIYIIF